MFSMNALHAEQLATELRGKIIAANLSDIEVFIKESDGAILDMTGISQNGTFKLDLTIMDIPSFTEVKKLIIEVKSKSGLKKNFPVKQYLSDFNDTVILNPIIIE